MTKADRSKSTRRLLVVVAAVLGVLAGALGALAATGRFSDVDASNVHANAIAWLSERGITYGCNPPVNDRFCPDDAVTREQMASFLKRFADSYGLDSAGDGGNGVDGRDGVDGMDGADGASAYEVAVEEGFVGTQSDWLQSLEGPVGPQGPPGADALTQVTLVDGFEPVTVFEPQSPYVVPVLSCPAEHIAISGGASWEIIFIGDASITTELSLTDGFPTGVTVSVFPDYSLDPFFDGILTPWVLCVPNPA